WRPGIPAEGKTPRGASAGPHGRSESATDMKRSDPSDSSPSTASVEETLPPERGRGQFRPFLGVTVGGLALMALAVVILLRFQGGHHLGKPGLRLSDTPLPDEEGGWATTNSLYLPEVLPGYRSEVVSVK